jgi:hypothetical protein
MNALTNTLLQEQELAITSQCTHKNSFVGVRAHIYIYALTNTLLQEQELAITSQKLTKTLL